MTEAPHQGSTGLSVIVPVYGPGPYLERVVNALLGQLPPIFQVIISHSGEGDPTRRFADLEGVTVLHSPRRLYAGAARNRGLEIATTDWVAFVDEDVIVDDGWHAALIEVITRDDADCIVGSIGYAESGGYWGMSLWFAEFSSVHPYRAPRPIPSGASANLAVRRELLNSIGGFCEDLATGEDSLAQAMLEVAGYSIRLEPSVAGRHVNLPGMRRVLRHYYRLGLSSARHRRMYPHLRGGTAVRWPILSIGMWFARIVQIYYRVFTRRHGPKISLIRHTPGILICLLAWNIGFTRSAFMRLGGYPRYPVKGVGEK